MANDFEAFVLKLLKKEFGCDGELATPNQRDYDIIVYENNKKVPVQVKNWRKRIPLPEVKKFIKFLNTDGAKSEGFYSGRFVSSNGFTKPCYTYINSDEGPQVDLGTIIDNQENKIIWNSIPLPDLPFRYIGVFTCKGGVGKSVIAAHLAGAFALADYKTALLDLDPRKNILNLFSTDNNMMTVPNPEKKTSNVQYEIIDSNKWDYKNSQNLKVLVCDCSPVFKSNPRKLMSLFNYCLIPTTLNPMGISKHAHVITDTV